MRIGPVNIPTPAALAIAGVAAVGLMVGGAAIANNDGPGETVQIRNVATGAAPTDSTLAGQHDYSSLAPTDPPLTSVTPGSATPLPSVTTTTTPPYQGNPYCMDEGWINLYNTFADNARVGLSPNLDPNLKQMGEDCQHAPAPNQHRLVVGPQYPDAGAPTEPAPTTS